MSEQNFEKETRKKASRTLTTPTLIAIISAAVLLAAALLYVFVLRQLIGPAAPEAVADTPPAPTQTLLATDPALPEPPVEEPPVEEPPMEQPPEEEPPVEELPERPDFDAPLVPVWSEAGTLPLAVETDYTKDLDLQVYSENAIVIDLATNTILAQKASDVRIYPASMTKVMTLLVACERITDWDETFRMTQAIIDPIYLSDATMAGFVNNEDVTMRDLVYGAILPSGAEATAALALHLAGSEEAFVAWMNEKAAELGLENTHFMDASGMHHEEHYTTLRDLAVILQAAMDNDICREVLSTPSYTSQPTEQNPEGVDMYNRFLLRAEAADQNGALIVGAKTGYTTEAMNCCASFGYSPEGRGLVCVTAHAWTGDFCLADHIALYSQYS